MYFPLSHYKLDQERKVSQTPGYKWYATCELEEDMLSESQEGISACLYFEGWRGKVRMETGYKLNFP